MHKDYGIPGGYYHSCRINCLEYIYLIYRYEGDLAAVKDYLAELNTVCPAFSPDQDLSNYDYMAIHEFQNSLLAKVQSIEVR